jgi:hypothetical protein
VGNRGAVERGEGGVGGSLQPRRSLRVVGGTPSTPVPPSPTRPPPSARKRKAPSSPMPGTNSQKPVPLVYLKSKNKNNEKTNSAALTQILKSQCHSIFTVHCHYQ